MKTAIFQVAIYLSYEFENPTQEQVAFHKKGLIYWKDIYAKLVALKQQGEKNEAFHSKIIKS